MHIDILSLFPEYFDGPFRVSIIKRALEKGLITIGLTDIREFAEGKHRKVDDRPFGGGPGMLLMPGPLMRAIRNKRRADSYVIYLSPQGRKLTSSLCCSLAKKEHLILVCGHYEGIDERVIEEEIDEEISIGDYVLTNGCIAALVLVDATMRFVHGCLGDDRSAQDDSFQHNLLKGPSYTRPENFEGKQVPEVLISGNHGAIEKWRKEKRREKTLRIRPDLCRRENNDETK